MYEDLMVICIKVLKLKKVSKVKIANVYATALYEAAVDVNSVENVNDDVLALKKLLSENDDFGNYFENPLWAQQDKKDVLLKISKLLGLRKETVGCLEVVIENGRISDLNLILDCFEKIYNSKNNVEKICVETVKKLSSKQDARLTKVMENILGKKILIDYVINPKILGGLRVQCGSRMFDDSLISKLNYLENIMKGK